MAQFNEHDVMIVKAKGEFVWHKHDDTDDFFLVLKGHLTIELRDRVVNLGPGEMFVVPKEWSIGRWQGKRFIYCSSSPQAHRTPVTLPLQLCDKSSRCTSQNAQLTMSTLNRIDHVHVQLTEVY